MIWSHYVMSWDTGRQQVLKDNSQFRHARSELKRDTKVKIKHWASSYLGYDEEPSFFFEMEMSTEVPP